jgi:hypothetical protein
MVVVLMMPFNLKIGTLIKCVPGFVI